MTKKILVTGGAGFIGGHLVGNLIVDGFDVTVVDNFWRGKKENLQKKWKSGNLGREKKTGELGNLKKYTTILCCIGEPLLF